MLTIRLQRAGKKNKPEYRLVLAEKTSASQKKFTEILGAYNPHTKVLQIRNQDRINYWVNEQHVALSATANNLLVSKEIIKGTKSKAFTIPKKEVVAEEQPAAESKTEATTAVDNSAPVAETVTDETPAPAATPEPVQEEVKVKEVVEAPVEAPAEAAPETPAAE